MANTIIYQIFDECSNYTLDPYWKEKFQDFSQNKFPQGVRYDPTGNSIILRIEGKKTEVIALPSTPEKTFKVIVNVLKDKLGLRSTRDLKIEKEEIEKIIEQRVCDTNCEWKQIKPRNIKDQMIMEYISFLKTKYDLNQIETRKLVAEIMIGFKFRYISPDDVIYVNGKIKRIEGLKINKKRKEFQLEKSRVTSKKAPARPTKPVPDVFYNSLDKYIKTQNTRRNKFAL